MCLHLQSKQSCRSIILKPRGACQSVWTPTFATKLHSIWAETFIYTVHPPFPWLQASFPGFLILFSECACTVWLHQLTCKVTLLSAGQGRAAEPQPQRSAPPIHAVTNLKCFRGGMEWAGFNLGWWQPCVHTWCLCLCLHVCIYVWERSRRRMEWNGVLRGPQHRNTSVETGESRGKGTKNMLEWGMARRRCKARWMEGWSRMKKCKVENSGMESEKRR